MIEGLRFQVTAEELRCHCEVRSTHYQRLCAIPRKTGLDANQTAEDHFRREDIKQKALQFAYWSRHLFDEVYNLSSYDLVQLELVPPGEEDAF